MSPLPRRIISADAPEGGSRIEGTWRNAFLPGRGAVPVSPRFKAWKAGLEGIPDTEAQFQKWLFLRISGVLFAGKGGELLILGAGADRLSIDRQIRCIGDLSRHWRYDHLLLCSNTPRARVVVYTPSKVRRSLSRVPPAALTALGYCSGVKPEEFLEEVGRRWREKGRIPHEIGLALGYPVKDVLGYIGLKHLRCTATCGWKVYGDPAPSLRKKKRYRRARKEAEYFLTGRSGRIQDPQRAPAPVRERPEALLPVPVARLSRHDAA